MARRSPNDINTVPCTTCGKVIRYKADVPRHNRLHDTNKAQMMYQCDFEGCAYENLQKSNVITHSRTHTGEKPKSCLECDYTTSDPGSLTRHRKRVHGYQPKKAGSSTTKQSRRHSPYSREQLVEISSSSCPPSSEANNDLLDLSAFYESCAIPSMKPQPETVDETHRASSNPYFTFVWQKDGSLCLEAVASPASPSSESLIRVPPAQMPHHLFPANNAGHALERDTLAHQRPPSMESSVEDLSVFPFDLFLSQCAEKIATPSMQPSTTICPSGTYTSRPPVTYSFQPTNIADQWKTELPFLFDGAHEPSLPTYLEDINHNVQGADFDCCSIDDMFISSPTPSLYTDSSNSPESFFLHSPTSSSASSILSYPNTPSFSPEMCFNSLIPVPPVEIVGGIPLSYMA